MFSSGSECTMKTSSTFLITVGFLALWMQLPPASCLPPIDKPGFCPRNPFRCSVPGHNQCSIDYDCPAEEKCCFFNCGKVCRPPQAKSGTCPSSPLKCSKPGKRDRCTNDYDCLENEKCCYFNCSKTCTAPRVPEKSGHCPTLSVFCSVPGVDTCSSDFQCTGKKKCCYLNCGKACVDP